jgi:hypothetical protein
LETLTKISIIIEKLNSKTMSSKNYFIRKDLLYGLFEIHVRLEDIEERLNPTYKIDDDSQKREDFENRIIEQNIINDAIEKLKEIYSLNEEESESFEDYLFLRSEKNGFNVLQEIRRIRNKYNF